MMDAQSTLSPWCAALKLPESDQELADLLRVAPKPSPHLHLLPIDDAANELDKELKKIRRLSAQDVKIVREIVGCARSHANDAYPCIQEFARQAQSRPDINEDPTVRMLTGPSGVGKSIIMSAIDWLYSSPLFVDVPGLAEFPIRSIVRFRLQKTTKYADRMNIIGEAAGFKMDGKKGGASDLQFLRRRLYQYGVSSLLPDELQFLAMGDSNAQVASIVLEFSLCGVPVFYGGNYSLANKLCSRPPEDVARLLSEPIVMLPDAFDDPAFRGLLDDFAVVLGVVDIDFDAHAHTIHRYTFGLRRFVRRIFKHAYRIMRREHLLLGTPMKLTMHHIDAAYDDGVAYGKDRMAVKKHQDDLRGTGKVDPKYHCPFELPKEQQLVRKLEADRLREEELNQELLKQSRTREEREQQEEKRRKEAAAMRKAQRAQALAADSNAKAESSAKGAGGTRAARPPQPTTADELLRVLNSRKEQLKSTKKR
jgi:hypothetical protein